MRNRQRTLLTLILSALLLTTAIQSEPDPSFDLKGLEGDWEGVGEFLVPATSMRMSLEGKANFLYDSASGHLRTSLVGEKLFFSYSDSGHLVLDEKTDSISWEVWDNFGKHAKYFGVVDGNVIKGVRDRKGKVYSVMIELVTADSIDFKLTITDPDGDKTDKATFNLWRVQQ